MPQSWRNLDALLLYWGEELWRRGKRQGSRVMAVGLGKTEWPTQFHSYMYSHTLDVLVSLSCYNKAPQTGWFISNRNLFRTVLEAGKSKSDMSAWLVSCKMLFRVADCQLLIMSSVSRRSERVLRGLCHKATDPSPEGTALLTNSPPQSLISLSWHQGLGFQHMNSGAKQTFNILIFFLFFRL